MNGETTIQACGNGFALPKQAKDAIEDLGYKAMTVTFGGMNTDALASLRYNLLNKKIVSAKAFVTPEHLLSTKSSTKYHCQRVYYQIMVWTEMDIDMNPVDWGWKLEDNWFLPVMTKKSCCPREPLADGPL